MGYKPRIGLVSDASNAFIQQYYLSHKIRREEKTPEISILHFKNLTHNFASLLFLRDALISIKGNTKDKTLITKCVTFSTYIIFIYFLNKPM